MILYNAMRLLDIKQKAARAISWEVIKMKNENKRLEILVVEDNPKHIEDAKAYFDQLSQSGVDVHVEYASNYKAAQQMMKDRRFDGVISDVFFPFEKVGEGKFMDPDPEDDASRIWLAWKHSGVWPLDCDPKSPYVDYQINVVKSMNSWCEGRSLMPRGVLMVEDAKKANIPIVLCSDAGHHSYALAPVHRYSRDQRVALCDFMNGESKDWARAYEALKLD